MRSCFLVLILCLLASSYCSAGDTLSVSREKVGDAIKYTYKISENGSVTTREVTVRKLGVKIDELDKSKISLLVSKSHYTLYVLYNEKPIKSFMAVFGSGGHLKDKMEEGDKRTPEGEFTITGIRDHAAWHKFLGISYPNSDSYRKFEENKRNKKISPNARIGGAIGIHGTFNNQDDVINRKFNWTDGCISLKNKDLEELVKYLDVGTKIKIIK